VSPGFILPFCRYRPVQADAGLPAWPSLPTELEYGEYATTVRQERRRRGDAERSKGKESHIKSKSEMLKSRWLTTTSVCASKLFTLQCDLLSIRLNHLR
jgi:hypothetical protein